MTWKTWGPDGIKKVMIAKNLIRQYRYGTGIFIKREVTPID